MAAVVLNATSVDTLMPGFITVGTAGAVAPGAKPTTSTMNVIRPAQVLANHAIVPVSSRGFSMFTEAGGNLLADLAGYFIGAAAPAPFGAPANSPVPTCTTPAVGFATAPVGPIIPGSSRAAVADLQNRLTALGFWVQAADGVYGLTTSQAVMAFQKWKGLPVHDGGRQRHRGRAEHPVLPSERPGATRAPCSRSTRASRSPTSSRTGS